MDLIVILSATIVFALIILVLSLSLVIAEAKLLPKTTVKLLINDDASKALTVNTGATLLNTLSNNSILLPSACGGGGTCGVCRCQIFTGAGDMLPTEEGHISRKDTKDHWRLACQVKIKEDMTIQVPSEVFSTNKWDCKVISNRNVATFIKEFVIQIPEGESLEFAPGGYVQIEVPEFTAAFKTMDIQKEYHDDWDSYKMWDLLCRCPESAVRAYSMVNHPAEGSHIKLNIRIATPPWDSQKNEFQPLPPGYASSYIFSRKSGDTVTLSGPYGDFFIQETDREMVYIGGGAGMAPLRSHIFHLFHTEKSKRNVSYWYGARSKRELFYEDEFRAIEKLFSNFSFNISLSEPLERDHWTGYTGFIHNVLYEHYLKDHPIPEDVEYYLCGPPMMLECSLKMLDDLGVEEDMIRFDDFGI